jgi:hypothetical protein
MKKVIVRKLNKKLEGENVARNTEKLSFHGNRTLVP